MLKTYTATLIGDRIEWSGDDRPTVDRPAKVMVTLLDNGLPPLPPSNGVAAAAILAEISTDGGLKEFGDPLEWQRTERQDRPLPGRGDE